MVLALSYRLALGVATSIFLRAHRRNFHSDTLFQLSIANSRTGLNAFSTSTRPINRAMIGSGIQRQTFGNSGRRS